MKGVEREHILKPVAKKIPMVHGIWRRIRERKILTEHQKVEAYWKPVIDAYFQGKLPKYDFKPKKRVYEKVIWQYWAQGLHGQLPEVVRLCFASVDRYKGDYTVIRLTDENITAYLDFPDFVWEKRKNPQFPTVFFSDLLRLALLRTYGGVWLDATVLLTDTLSEVYHRMDYFMYQRDPDAVRKDEWADSYAYYRSWHPQFRVNMLSSIICAKRESKILSSLLDLMLRYWKQEDKVINYFFFQILYDVLIKNQLKDCKCPVVDDTLPHLLQMKINGGLRDMGYPEILNQQAIHKLTYLDKSGTRELKNLLNTAL